MAGKRYWVGTGANKNWNSTANWASTSGGTTGSAVPGSADSVYFDANGDSTCSINATVSIKYLNISSGYTHTITQNSNSITVGTSGIVLSGGAFSGGSSSITDNGIFTLSGTNFTSTSGTLSIFGNYNFSSGTFSHNNGNVTIAASLSITGSTNFYDLTLSAFLTLTINAASTFNVTHLFSQSGSGGVVINTGTINVQGDITQAGTSATGGGTGTICINGTGTQNFNGVASLSLNGRLCNIKINKASGTLYLKDYIRLSGTWEYVQGTVDVSTYTSTVVFPVSGSPVIKGTQRFYGLYLASSSGANTLTVQSGDTLTVLNTLSTAGTASVFFVGEYYLQGDISVTNTNVTTTIAGTGVIHITGTGSQTITGAAAIAQGKLCNIIVDKPSGTLTLKNYVNLEGGWTHTQGTVDAATYSSTVAFLNGSRTISGKPSFYNVSFYGASSSTNTIVDTLTINGLMTTEGINAVSLNTGVINVKGDITVNNTSTSISTGSATIYVATNGSQTITGASSLAVGNFCNVKINKSGGTLTLKNFVNVAGNWTYVQGTIDASTYSSTVDFVNTSAQTISGSHSLNNVSVSGANVTITSGDTLTVDGTFKLEAGGNPFINTGTINAKGNITVVNLSTAGGGSGWLNICGASSQTLTGSGVANNGRLCNVKVNKPSGTLYLASTFTLGAASPLTVDWVYLRGTVDAGTSEIAFFGDGNVSCKNGSNSMSFNDFYVQSGTRTLNGDVNVSGDLIIALSKTLSASSYNLTVGKNWLRSGTFTAGTSMVIFNGSVNQHLTGATTFYNLKINKPSGKFRLSAAATVNNTLTLTKGVVTTTSTNIISLIDNATSGTGTDSSYISGPFKKTGNDAFTFPLGDTLLSSGAYHPLSITAPGSTTDAFTAQYYSVNQSVGSTKVDSIDLSTCEYWTIARNVGSSNINTTLGWNTNNCHTTNAYDMVVSGWDGTNSIWKSLENTNITIAGSKGTVTAAVTPYWSGTSAVNIMIAKKKAINITELVHDPYCFPGATRGFAHIGVTYGAPPYTYAWSNSATTQDIDSLTAGTYSLTITDRYSRTFTRNYTLQNCVSWSTLPSGLSSDTTGQLHKSTGDTTWIAAQSALIIDTMQTGRWIKFTIADTTTKFLLGFGPVAIDSVEEEANLMMFMEGSVLTVIETDNDGFYSKEVIGSVAVNDELKIEMDESRGILYYKNNVLIYTGKLLSNSRMQLTANIYGSSKNIKKIRCSSNN